MKDYGATKMIKIKVTLDEHVRECDHCGAKHLRHSFCVQLPNEEKMYIGRICIERLTNINTSGNPHRATNKIQNYLNSLDEDEVIILFSELEL